MPVCWWFSMWIIYQWKCRNNLIEEKRTLLEMKLCFFFFLKKNKFISFDAVRLCCQCLLFCILKARCLQLSAITTTLMTSPLWVTYRNAILKFVVSVNMRLLLRLFVSLPQSETARGKCCLTQLTFVRLTLVCNKKIKKYEMCWFSHLCRWLLNLVIWQAPRKISNKLCLCYFGRMGMQPI